MDRKERLKRVSVAVSRPSEHTRWRPRIERGPGFGMFAFGVFFVTWDLEYNRPWSPADDVVSEPMSASSFVKMDDPYKPKPGPYC